MLALIIFQRMLGKTAWDSGAAQLLIELRVSFPGLKRRVLSFSRPGMGTAVAALCTQAIFLNNCPVLMKYLDSSITQEGFKRSSSSVAASISIQCNELRLVPNVALARRC